MQAMKRMRFLRRKAGLTQLEMGRKLGISESYYCQLENKKRGMSLEMAIDIANVLGMTLNDIFLPSHLAKRHVVRGAEGKSAS